LSRGEGRREFFFSCIFTYSFSTLLLKLTIYFITQLVLASAKTSWENALKSTQSQIFFNQNPPIPHKSLFYENSSPSLPSFGEIPPIFAQNYPQIAFWETFFEIDF
jgi:hypothetical protein